MPNMKSAIQNHNANLRTIVIKVPKSKVLVSFTHSRSECYWFKVRKDYLIYQKNCVTFLVKVMQDSR